MPNWEDYYCRGYGIDPDMARERLDFLKLEQDRAKAMFNPYDDLPDEPFFYTKTLHALSFACQCIACVRLHTATSDDKKFLDSIGIVWQISAEN